MRGSFFVSIAFPSHEEATVPRVSRRRLLGALAAGVAGAAFPRFARATDVRRIGVDYAYYNPVSLVLQQKGWLERALAETGTSVDWVLSLGSNKANGFLAANAVQFGSTAGSAAFLARANGTPIKTGVPVLAARVDGAGGLEDLDVAVGRRSQRKARRCHAGHRSVVLPFALAA
jgi:hypothetical protein